MGGLLWCSIPCTGGSIRNDMNPARFKPEFQRNLRRHQTVARQLWQNFEILAEKAIRHGWIIVIEWPNSCKYWKWPAVRRFCAKHSLVRAYCRGCAVGLQDDAGVPIAKPWRMVTNSVTMYDVLDSCRCPGRCTRSMQSAKGTMPRDLKVLLLLWRARFMRRSFRICRFLRVTLHVAQSASVRFLT